MRAATTIAKAATRLTWPLTRLDRNGDLSRLTVLCYHRVLPAHGRAPLPRYAVTLRQFREQMSLLTDEGFKSLSLDDVRDATSGKRQLPERPVLITFDDGLADIHRWAWPIAQEFRMKLNLFVCTGLLVGESVDNFAPQTRADWESWRDSPDLWRPLTWDEVREMNRMDVGLGFHSHAHRNHGRLGREEIAADATRGLAVLEREVGFRPKAFAFPYGHYSSYSARAISVLREHGFETFFTTEMERTSLPSAGPISRLVIHPEDDLRSFRRKLYGGYDWVGKLRRSAYAIGATLRPETQSPSRA
jgi:peptidoglycan/xylan/chitin deacetylase (PgdA/CDA1 family)